MRSTTMRAPSTIVSVLTGLLCTSQVVKAGPLVEELKKGLGYGYLLDRAACGGTLCGVYDQLCCSVGSACYTDVNTEAQCSATAAAAAASGWQYYTTTFVETDFQTVTSVYSTYMGATPTVTSVPAETTTACTPGNGETACGAICCASNQYCLRLGQCMEIGASLSTSPATSTTAYSAPTRPTTGDLTATSTVSATTTETFIPPASATTTGAAVGSSGGSSSSGLSAGAIAGIVIGTLAAIVLLILFCFCCILRLGFDGLMAILGLGKKKDRRSERTEIIEERYSRHGSAAGRSNTHRGWFGFGGGRPARVEEKRKKESAFGGLGWLGAGAIGLAVILGLRKKQEKDERRSNRPSSVSSYTSYTDSYTGTSASSESSDGRTRDSRRNR